MKQTAVFLLTMVFVSAPAPANEVIEETHTKVVVRHHPKTGQPFVSITAEDAAQYPFPEPKVMKRPDYRMLDPKMKSGAIPYEGPVSDRKKVYILAASLAAVGTVGGVGIIAAAPAATGAGAAGGAGVYGAAGGAVAVGSISGAVAATRSDPEKANFTHVSEAHAVKEEPVESLAKPE
jgi:hypothetical protein